MPQAKEWFDLEAVSYDNPVEVIQYLRHQGAYTFAQEYCYAKLVLEVGCGAATAPRSSPESPGT